MKRIFVASLALSLFIGLPAAMSAPLDSITEKLNKTAQDRFGVDTDLFIQTMDFVDPAGTYYVSSDDPGGINTASITPTKEHSRFSAILLPCLDSNLNICIDSVSYKEVTSTNWKMAKLVTPINLSRTGQVAMTYQDGTSQNFGSFSEDLSNNRPAGGNASVWSMEGAQHKGGDEYFVSVGVSNFPSGYRQDPLDLNIAIKPIRVTTPGDVRQYGFPNNVRQYQFPEKIEYRVSIRLGTLLPKLSKWYSARLGSPSISIRGDLLEVSGTSVMVPLARSLPIP